MNKKLFYLFLLIPFYMQGQNNIQNLILSAGDGKDFPGVNTLAVFDSTNVSVKETGLSYVNIHSLIKILTSEGALAYSVVKSDYDPLSASVKIMKVIIYHKDGKITVLDTSKVLDYPAPAGAIYWGSREKMLEAGRLETGDAIEIFLFRKGFTYALLQDDDDKYIPPMKGHFYDIIPFWTSEAVKNKVYKITLPLDKPLQYKFYNGEVQIDARISGDKMIYTFSKKNIKAFKSEPNMVAVSDVAPKLLLSTSPDWQAKSRWFYQVNEDYGSFKPTPEIKAKVNEILKNAKDEMDSVSLLTHWAGDEIRYLGLSMGKGEGYTLHSGSTIFSDRCGVCKDKASMLITLLRAAGFEAYAAMTMAGSKIDDIPSDQFNHSVTVVKLKDGKFHLLDPTWVPFVRELWSSLEQQQNYLIGTKEGEPLNITPLSDPENHYYKIEGNSELSADGSLTGEFTIEAEGQSDASFRNSMTRNFRSTWYRYYESELLKDFPQMQIIELKFSDGYDYSKPFKLYLKYKIPGYSLTGRDQIFFTPVVASNIFLSKNNYLKISTNNETRKYSFRDACSKSVYLQETIKIPQGYEVNYLPSSDTVTGNAAVFYGGYNINGNTIYVNEHIILKKRIYDPADWDNFRKVVFAQKKMAREKVILVKNQTNVLKTK